MAWKGCAFAQETKKMKSRETQGSPVLNQPTIWIFTKAVEFSAQITGILTLDLHFLSHTPDRHHK